MRVRVKEGGSWDGMKSSHRFWSLLRGPDSWVERERERPRKIEKEDSERVREKEEEERREGEKERDEEKDLSTI